jgi:Xaa-Pro aminopeptidase
MLGQNIKDTLGTAGMILLSCAGNNANTIHYIESVGGVEAGDLLVMEAGTEYQGYSWNCWNDSSFLCSQ